MSTYYIFLVRSGTCIPGDFNKKYHFLHVSIKCRNSLIRPIGLVMIIIYLFSSLITTLILYNRGGQKVKRQIHVDTCDIILICNVEFGKSYVSYVSMTAKFLVTCLVKL